MLVLAALLALASGCAASYDAGAEAPQDAGSNNGGGFNEAPNGREVSLYDTSLKQARAAYEDNLSIDSGDGHAAAGHAVTDLLLLPYASETTDVLRHMGASDSLDAQGDVIYGESGFLYFVSRGVPWEDSGPDTVGIKSLLVDQLPWTRRQLDTVDGFVEGLNTPVDLIVEDLVRFATRLDSIRGDIDTALSSDNFTTFFVPGEVFYDESLNLTLGPAELSLLDAALAGVQTGIYGFAAYDHGWTVERAFGTPVWEEVVSDPEHPDHVVGWTAEDYQVSHVNESFLKSIDRPMQLLRAQQAWIDTMASLQRALEFGLEQTIETTLTWQDVDADAARDLIEFFASLEAAATGPSELPFTEPALTVDLSPLFGDGRTLPDEVSAFTLETYENEFGATVTSLEFREEAIEVLTGGVFDPPYGSEPAPELSTAEDFERAVDAVIGEFTSRVERTYSSSF